MSKITSRTFARHEDVDDANYSANVTQLMHTTQGGPTAGIPSLKISSICIIFRWTHLRRTLMFTSDATKARSFARKFVNYELSFFVSYVSMEKMITVRVRI